MVPLSLLLSICFYYSAIGIRINTLNFLKGIRHPFLPYFISIILTSTICFQSFALIKWKLITDSSLYIIIWEFSLNFMYINTLITKFPNYLAYLISIRYDNIYWYNDNRLIIKWTPSANKPFNKRWVHIYYYRGVGYTC